MRVTLRQRLKGKKINLFLEYYTRGKRRYEHLQLYLHPEPEQGKLSKSQKEENKQNLQLAEAIRSKKHLEIQNGLYGFADTSKLEGSFIEYVLHLTEKRKDSKNNYDNWDSALKHLKKFSPEVTFRQIDKKWIESFKSYLQKNARTPAKQPLAQNSQHSYFNKIRAAIREATREGILTRNPVDQVEGIKPAETERKFLTYDELKNMAKTECDIAILKTAFLFSALTGLRWSDIQKLVWSEIQHSKELGHFIRFRQKKTNGAETLPINDEAFALLGPREGSEERVFVTLKYSSWHNIKLQQWAMRAGISRTVTFHCARHTFATTQLTLGTDVYTLQKMMGHQHINTTQIYGKVIDEKKREAANKISLSPSI